MQFTHNHFICRYYPIHDYYLFSINGEHLIFVVGYFKGFFSSLIRFTSLWEFSFYLSRSQLYSMFCLVRFVVTLFLWLPYFVKLPIECCMFNPLLCEVFFSSSSSAIFRSVLPGSVYTLRYGRHSLRYTDTFFWSLLSIKRYTMQISHVIL